MAVVQDTLETVLRLVGFSTYLGAFREITGAVSGLVVELGQYDRELLRVQAFQRQLGQTLPAGQIEQFGQQLSLAAGVSQTEILQTLDYLSRYGVSARQAEADTQTLARASQATGVSMVRLAEGIEMARRGHARELFRELGIPVRGVADQLYSFDQLLKLVDLHTRDMALGFGNTLPGALARTSTAFENARLQVAKLIEPVATTWLQGLGIMLRMFAGDIQALREGRWADFFSGRAAQNALKDAAFGGGAGGGESASEKYLRKIEFNTGPQGTLGRATRGGGSFAEPGGGLRIRDFNQMFRRIT